MTATTTQDATLSDDYRLPVMRLQPQTMVAASGILLAFALGLALLTSAWERLAHAYLLGISFCLSISLGSLFFVILQHLTGARWSVIMRRIAELLTCAIPWLGVLFAPIVIFMLLGDSHLYEWNDAGLVKSEQLLAHKAAFLNAPFFALRCGFYFAVWTGLSRFFLTNSVKQDAGDGNATRQMKRWSGPAMIAFALTVNFAAFDLLMSLDPLWFSTIYGIYFFSGCVVAIISALTLAVVVLQTSGILRKEINEEHFHDLGKLMFGFVFFWGYIAFSQYLLIWYAAIPEETVWYATRQQHGWQFVSLALLLGHFLIPFAGLMSRSVRRSRKALAAWSVFLLVMHLVDLFYLIIPSVSPNSAAPTLIDGCCVLAVAVFWLGITLRSMSSYRLVSKGDPFIEESLAFHNF